MKILITGGAGFIGSNLADALIQKGHSIIIIDNLSTGRIENINRIAKFYNIDLNNFSKLNELFEIEKPEIVYHLAAQINVRKSVENPMEDAQQNIINTLNLLELSIKNKIKHFIFSSSGGAIYGNAITPTKEIEKEKPISPYGCAKLTIEKYIDYYHEIFGLKYTILRYSNVYGPRQNSEGEAGVISIFIKNMLQGINPIIYGGLQTRDFVYISDVIKANLLALEENKSEVYNVGTSTETDIIELFNKINSLFNNKFKAEYREKKKGEQMISCLDYSKIKQNLFWIPEIDLETGLKKTWEYYKNAKS